MFLLGGCSTADLINSRALGAWRPDVTDVAYAEGARHTLDVYKPALRAKSAPVVVFIYGGGWDSGEKETYHFLGSSFAAQGFVTFIPDYRVYPEVRYPDFIRDAATAIAWVKAHAAAYGGDPTRIALVGHSAGAYIAAMLALDPTWLAADGLDPMRDLRAVVGLSGPYDFLPLHSDELKTIFGPPDTLVKTQPITYVTGQAPPMLLATSRDDDTVDPGNTTRLADRIRGAGGTVETRVYPRLSHRLMVGAIAWPLRFMGPVLDDTTEFLRAHMEGPAG
jgi:acetyl esterase/lipase